MMKKAVALLLAAVLLLSCTACSAPAKATETAPTAVPAETAPVSTVPAANVTEPTAEVKPEINEAELPYDYQTADGLLRITLPNRNWGQLYTDEHDALFSDGNCAIAVDLYRAKDSLPPIPTADETHQLIFTSAVSAEEYVLFLIGYAGTETDFSDLAAAINSIKLDKTRITKAWPEDAPPARTYSICDTNYTAWVSANTLNVRTGSGTENAIICQLTRDTKLTVTGEVLEGNNYIGWSRVRLSNGTVGYVSSQFLTTTKPEPKPTRTGNSKVLYSIRGKAYTVYEYTDFNWRTESGTVYWPATFSTWESASGQVLYDYDPSAPEYAEPQLTSQKVLLYSADGSMTQTVYLATDGEWYNSSWVNFYPAGDGVWYCGGAVFYEYVPTPEPTAPAPEPTTGPAANWKETFETALWAHDAMVPVEYTLLYEGTYEVLCRDPDSDATKTVIIDSYTGGWE